MKRKGAVELSMQTIIVVVIGVTLLILGLRFVTTTFFSIEEQQKTISASTAEQLRQLFGEVEDPLTLMQTTVNMGMDESVDINLMVKNVGTADYDFWYDINVAGVPGGVSKTDVEDWIGCSYCKEEWKEPIRPGRTIPDILSIDPRDAVPGRYRIELVMHCTGNDCEDGYKLPLTMRLT